MQYCSCYSTNTKAIHLPTFTTIPPPQSTTVAFSIWMGMVTHGLVSPCGGGDDGNGIPLLSLVQ